MKTNGDALRKILSGMSDKELAKYMCRSDITTIIGDEKHSCKTNCINIGKNCKDCIKEYLSKPYEEPKRWYLHRHSSSRGCELYYSDKMEVYTNRCFAKNFTFEEACRVRTELNKNRETKKNLWYISEEKENEK